MNTARVAELLRELANALEADDDAMVRAAGVAKPPRVLPMPKARRPAYSSKTEASAEDISRADKVLRDRGFMFVSRSSR